MLGHFWKFLNRLTAFCLFYLPWAWHSSASASNFIFPMAPMLCKKAVVNMAKLFMLLTDNQTCRQHPFISRWIFSAKCRWFEKNGISRWLARRKWNKMETSWAELGLTQAETVSLELKLKLSLFDLTDPPTQIELTKQLLHIYLNWFRFKHIYRSLAPN